MVRLVRLLHTSGGRQYELLDVSTSVRRAGLELRIDQGQGMGELSRHTHKAWTHLQGRTRPVFQGHVVWECLCVSRVLCQTAAWNLTKIAHWLIAALPRRNIVQATGPLVHRISPR